MGRKKSYLPLLFIVVFCICYTLLNPYSTAFHARNAVKICAFSLVPSLFVFMVFSRMLSHLCTRISSHGKITLILSRFLKLPPYIIPICISGLFCGAPSGAFAVSRIYQNGICSEKQAEKAFIISNNCSAAFILGFVCSVLGNKAACFYILVSNITSTLLIYTLFFRDIQSETNMSSHLQPSSESFTKMLTDSISASVTATATLCGYVLFFYTFSQTICDRLLPVIVKFTSSEFSHVFITVISFFSEITSGVLRIENIDTEKAIVICASFVAFTGLSMIFQVCDVMTKCNIPVKNFIISKILCAMVSPVITTLLLLISPKSILVYAQNTQKVHGGITGADVLSLIFVTLITFIGAYILTYLDKKYKK